MGRKPRDLLIGGTDQMRKGIISLFIIAAFILLNYGVSQSAKAVDEIQENYHERLFDIMTDTNKKQYDLKCAYIEQKHYQGVKVERMVKEAETEYEKVGKDIRLLKTEIIQYYKGKVPKKLKTMMEKTEKKYVDAKMEALDVLLKKEGL
jgi:hypothetical protein